MPRDRKYATVFISKELHQRLRVYCAVHRVKMGEVCEQAVATWLKFAESLESSSGGVESAGGSGREVGLGGAEGWILAERIDALRSVGSVGESRSQPTPPSGGEPGSDESGETF